ncbi:MAG TPA: glycosyl hydrolase [Verrucomicrobiota bacterium]|nr:glycosyl hydrolase [Verrucomicrobiota bacterium]
MRRTSVCVTGMKSFCTILCAALLFVSGVGVIASSADTSLPRQFTDPSWEARPWVFWYWINGNVTREGITKDLEAMKEVGIGGAYLFSITTYVRKNFITPPADSLTPHWWELVTHAMGEAKRLDLKLAFNACDGWATASGPWITPEMSMQKVVWSTTRITNSATFDGALPQPESNLGYYRDIAVMAFPTPPGSGESSRTRKPKVTSNIPGITPENALDEELSVEASEKGWIQYSFDAPFTCRSIRILPAGANHQPNRLEIQVSDDGKQFRPLGRLEAARHGWQDSGTPSTHSIPETTAKHFRFVYDPDGTEAGKEDLDSAKFSKRLKVRLIELRGEAALNQYEGKSGLKWRWGRPTSTNQIPDALCVPSHSITNLTSQFSDGRLSWQPPAGDWTILRMGYTTTGQESAMGGAGKGLECDKFNPAALQIQFDHWLGVAAKRAAAIGASDTLWMSHVDSWESDSQNWSPVFDNEFRKRRGYDPVPFLPAMAGIPVQSAETSERFLLDVRRTIAELVADHFFKPLTRLSHANGLKLSAEAVAPTMMSDGMLHHGIVDFPMGEFWLRSPTHDKPTDIHEAVSAAHVYGKPVVQAEAFTELRMQWDETPFLLKAVGDANFCAGINRFVFHVYSQQPDDREPGVTLNSVGTHFSRSQTWWQQGAAWIDYLTRSQALLQQGRYAADVCYFTGEDLPSRGLIPEKLKPALPDGYAYDSINRDALLTEATVRQGRLVLRSGMEYRVLVLPDDVRMTPQVAERIREFVRGGLVIVGPKPQRSPSLENQPAADAIVRSVAETVWADCDGDRVKQRRAGRGQVFWGMSLEDVFKEIDLQPDVRFGKGGEQAADFKWIHRTRDSEDWYFVSNQKLSSQTVDASFRVTGRVPELWHPDTGAIEDAPVWRVEEGRTIVPLQLGPAGSVFVVFRRESTNSDAVAGIVSGQMASLESSALPALKLERNANGNLEAWASQAGDWKLQFQSGREISINAASLPAPQLLAGPWFVDFPPGNGAPQRIELAGLESLSRHPQEDVRHFSGTATYTKEFDWKPSVSAVRSSRVFLDLGHVADLAEVRLNGKPLGVLWKPPFIVEVTDGLNTGKNRLEIEVTTTWRNRLIGDAGLPPERRVTWSMHTDAWFPKDTPLSDSGLVGPVRLQSVNNVQLP